MQRSQLKFNPACGAALLLAGAVFFVAVPTRAEMSGPGTEAGSVADRRAPAAGIAGVVRDAQGVAQMGALVQVLTGNSVTVATAFTDRWGHYSFADLSPGRYLVRASATLFVPVTRNNLQLRTGATAIVNLTLAALYDTASWLPAQRRRADETSDEWKWTLRSTANRPILRIVEEGSNVEVSSSAIDAVPVLRARARESVVSGDGSFGQGGLHNVITIHEGMDDGSDVLLRANLGTGLRETSDAAGASNAVGASLEGSELEVGFEGRTGFNGGAVRTVATYKSHPELVGDGIAPGADGGTGMQVLELTSAQRLAVGDRVEVEAGGRMDVIHEGVTAVSSHPFLRAKAHLNGAWTLEYRLASDRAVQEFDDVTSGDSDVPVALMRGGHLAVERGLHQEVGLERRAPRISAKVAFYHDGISQAAIAGGETGTFAADTYVSGLDPKPIAAASGITVSSGILLDPTTGSFRTLAGSYTSEGARLSFSSAITPSLWIAAEYSSGRALSVATPPDHGLPVGVQEALGELAAVRSQAATIALKGRLLGTATRVRASYRWQPTRDVTAVDGYSAFGDQAYLSCMLRQPIHLGHSLPRGLEATVDVTNLLAQGYRPFLSADGQTLYFAQAPRTIQAGLSFSF